MPGLQSTYPIGGVLDRVKSLPPLEVWKMPGQPTKTEPFAKGFRIEVPPATGTFIQEYTLPEEMELVSISVGCSGYADQDYWELDRDGRVIFETMYTKEVPESHAMGAGAGVMLLPAGTKLTVRFVNGSGTSKIVWVNLRFLRDPATP